MGMTCPKDPLLSLLNKHHFTNTKKGTWLFNYRIYF